MGLKSKRVNLASQAQLEHSLERRGVARVNGRSTAIWKTSLVLGAVLLVNGWGGSTADVRAQSGGAVSEGVGAGGLPGSQSSSVRSVGVFPGTTAPSQSRQVGFDIRGVVAEVKVERGSRVKAGDVLMRLDDSEERAQLEVAMLRTDVSKQLAEAEARVKLAEVQYGREKANFDKGVSSEGLVQEREAELLVAQARLAQVEQEGRIAKAQHFAQLKRVEKYTRHSPIDGVIREITRREGENVDETRPVLEIVSIDPLYIDVRLVPNDVVRKLSVGQSIEVRYGAGSWKSATVNFIDPVGDARSGTRYFRLELPNPDHIESIDAGVTVDVRVPASLLAGST